MTSVSRLRRTLLGVAATLTALAWSVGAWAQTPARSVAISDLMRLSPAEVRARLEGVGADWPLQPAFQFAGPNGVLTFIEVQDLMLDPVSARHLAVFRTQGDLIPWEPYVQCQTKLIQTGAPPMPGGDSLLVFRDGRLEAALARHVELDLPPPSADQKALRAWVLRPRTSPFIGRPGDLPLQDGAAFMSRWGRDPLAPGDRLSVACTPAIPPTPPARARGQGLDASDMQGLALLPFAITLPGKNRQREDARVRGHDLLQALRVGDKLPGAAERFARAHAGVRAYRSADGGYAVLSIDLGGYAGRNLSNFNDVALVGVRDDRIEWIAPPSYSDGPGPTLLCLDAKGVPGTPRPGCSGWGHFSP